jgi:hypothetical protein
MMVWVVRQVFLAAMPAAAGGGGGGGGGGFLFTPGLVVT